jgi:DDE superfamily endonuclease/Tc5 transposase DNA-binding domain
MEFSNSNLDALADRAADEVRERRDAGEHVFVAQVARAYGVDRKRVSRRLKGVGGRTSRKPANYKLSEIQETALIQYIRTLDEIGTGVRQEQVINTANSILRQDHTGDGEAPVVGEHWSHRFNLRHPELHKMKQKPIELARKAAHDPVLISDWFRRFQALREEFGVVDDDIWNFDETGFRIGVGRSQWIVTTCTSKRSYLATDGARTLITSVEAVSAGGAVIEEMLIVPGKSHMASWYNDLSDDVLVGVSDTGYTNDELSYEYMLHFHRQSRKTQVGAHRILLCDGYGSHITREILEFCEKKQIHMFCLPPHTSHILQPLDVVLFQPYKHYHAKAIDYASRTGCGDFNKLEFLHAIGSIRQQTFKKNSILSSFRECGLIPYRPTVVLTKVREYEAPRDPRRLSTPPSHIPGFTPEPITPKTDRALQRHADALEIATPSRKGVLEEQFKKGALIVAKCSAQLRETLAENTAAERERKARKAQPKRLLQSGGTIYAFKARNMVRQRDIEGGTQLQRALTRESLLEIEIEELNEEHEKERRAYDELRREFERNNS